MSSREAFSLPPGCALRSDFPEGVVHVEMVGAESPRGPSYVDLHRQPRNAVPRVPTLHLQLDAGTNASYLVEAALHRTHAKGEVCFSDADYGCIALDSLGAVVRRHRQEVLVG